MLFYHQTILEEAYQWLCRQRKKYHFNNDVWHLRAHWIAETEKLLTVLHNQTYTFDFVEKIQTPGRCTFLWSAKDALVLKMLAIHLRKVLAPVLSKQIYHLAGTKTEKRGVQAAVKKVYAALPSGIIYK